MSKLERTKKFRMNKLARPKKSWEMPSRSNRVATALLVLDCQWNLGSSDCPVFFKASCSFSFSVDGALGHDLLTVALVNVMWRRRD
jgi:hypothetical protein